MTHTKQFIEDVIEGGFTETESWSFSKNIEDNGFEMMADHSFSNIFMEMVLQPSAWEACGKVRGWIHFGDCRYHPVGNLCRVCSAGDYKDKQHQFLTNLQDNKSIEESLSML